MCYLLHVFPSHGRNVEDKGAFSNLSGTLKRVVEHIEEEINMVPDVGVGPLTLAKGGNEACFRGYELSYGELLLLSAVA